MGDGVWTSGPATVVVLDDYQGVALSFGDWDRLGDRVEVRSVREHIGELDALVAELSDAQVVVAMRERTALPRQLFERLPELRLVVTTGMGNAVIDMDAARDHGVTVCGTWGMIEPTVELTWALLLAVMRDLTGEHGSVRAGGWQRSIGYGVSGRTLGVVGLGNIGSRVARVGTAFGMSIIAWSENMTAQRAAECGATLVTRDELFERSDAVTIHLVLSDRTRGLVGSEELGRMKKSSYLVNTSRGPIVDEAALVDVLRRNAVAGAALDVFDTEPLPADHPLRSLPNVVLTPHIGYVTAECYEIFYRDIVEDIDAFLRGEPVRRIAG